MCFFCGVVTLLCRGGEQTLLMCVCVHASGSSLTPQRDPAAVVDGEKWPENTVAQQFFGRHI